MKFDMILGSEFAMCPADWIYEKDVYMFVHLMSELLCCAVTPSQNCACLMPKTPTMGYLTNVRSVH